MLSSGTKHTNKDDRRSSKYKYDHCDWVGSPSNPSIKFTWEEVQDNQLPVLNFMIKRDSNHKPRFAVERKPTCKDDYIHYLSAHSEKVKSGVVIGLFLRTSIQGLQDTYGVPGGRVQSRHWSVQRAPLSRGYAAAPPQDSDCYQGAGPSPAPAGHLANHRGSSLSPDGTTGGTSGSPLENRHSSIDEDRRDCQDTQTTTRPWGQRHLQDRIRRGQLQGILEIFYPRQTCRELKKRLSEHVAAYNKRYQQSPFKMGNGPPARLETGRGRALRHWV